jgi:hypothetical protein
MSTASRGFGSWVTSGWQYFGSVVVPRLREGHAEFLGPMRDAAKYELLGGSTALVLLPNYADPCPVVALAWVSAPVLDPLDPVISKPRWCSAQQRPGRRWGPIQRSSRRSVTRPFLRPTPG